MKKTSEPIVFFGSGPVAAASLEFLAEHFPIEAVITKPRPNNHRGPVPVLELARDLGLTTYTADNKQALNHLFEERPVKARVAILVDFGIIVSQQVIDYFEMGIVNSHFSLLPEWRGADPITFSILSGQERTGVSLMLLTAGMDEGPILATGEHNLSPKTTIYDLTSDLIALSNGLLEAMVPAYLGGNAAPVPQEQSAELLGISPTPTYSRKITKADGRLDFEKPAEVLEREIRAFLEWPKSRTTLGNIEVIITEAHTSSSAVEAEPGHVEINLSEGALMINTSDGYLCVDKLKPAGKKEMSAAEFLRGYGGRL